MNDTIKLSTEDLEELKNVCEVCQQAKQTRLKFGTGRLKAERPLQIIHTDLCGPIDPCTWNGKRYFITFQDDYTHYTFVYLLDNKTEVQEILKEFVKRVEVYWNLKVSKIRCDNGREFINKDIQAWSKSKGIIIDTTTPYTPQLNGRTERLNRTLLDKVRALLFDSILNKEMWVEALYCATYILNRLPSNILEKTPFEMWEKRKPNLELMQIFGNIAHTKNLGPLKKLEARSRKLFFVGYAPNGYRLWSQEKRKIIIARDVVFEEIHEKEKISTQNKKIKFIQMEKESDEEVEEELLDNENWEDAQEQQADNTSDSQEENNNLINVKRKSIR
ncbi:Copia protein [Trachymyrmex cornetzi]|uniref:Copia protein n=1 Tax=Trachymyrmex cornetzi TaxID=471704 RepID=A0A151J1Q0_9HYME|nr:Copia protein [Trachymyrmex cornetzi]